MPLMPEAAPQRRRGRALEEALLDAAWDELTERGYDAFTIDGAAARAGTSRAVLYRRWPTKQDLVHAVVVREVGRDVITAPDTGSLRGDVIALLRLANERRVRMATDLFTNLGSFYRSSGTSFGDLRELIPGGRDSIMDAFIQRATDRGEIRRGQISARVARLPMDLFRQEVLMTLNPVAERDIEEIVDTIFLPLVHGGSATKEKELTGRGAGAH
jgi:AcrR family transcriptional regulator